MNDDFLSHLVQQTKALSKEGLFKEERTLESPQQVHITSNKKKVLNFCANNYLGLANHPEIIQAAQEALSIYGYGMSSVRFICGTQDIHKKLEQKLSNFLGTEDTILYSSCFDANAGLFETILGPEDAIISDALNHASIIDGIRLCKAKRIRYHNNDMQDLEQKLQSLNASTRFRMICTDGVFSMDGYFAKLDEISKLAKKYQTLLMVDDSHAVGFIGKKGTGTPELFGVRDQVDILTGTLGKALGGASGGYTSGKKEIVTWLRQRSRPYLFSNTLAPVITAASLKALEIIEQSSQLREQLENNTSYFRQKMTERGFTILPGKHPIVPVMIKDAKLAQEMAKQLLAENIYVISFSYPVVPRDLARIRVQISAAHTKEDLDLAIKAFTKTAFTLKILS
jgi:glycine C-acetyltransferase